MTFREWLTANFSEEFEQLGLDPIPLPYIPRTDDPYALKSKNPPKRHTAKNRTASQKPLGYYGQNTLSLTTFDRKNDDEAINGIKVQGLRGQFEH